MNHSVGRRDCLPPLSHIVIVCVVCMYLSKWHVSGSILYVFRPEMLLVRIACRANEIEVINLWQAWSSLFGLRIKQYKCCLDLWECC